MSETRRQSKSTDIPANSPVAQGETSQPVDSPLCPLCQVTPCIPRGPVVNGVVRLWQCPTCQPVRIWPSWLWPINERLDRALLAYLANQPEAPYALD